MRPVVAALKTAVEAQVARVYLAGDVPNSPTLPYVVVTAQTPTPGDYSHAATSKSRRWRFVTLYVGDSTTSCMWLAEKVETALLEQRLTVADWSCSKIRREAGKPIGPDYDVESLVSGADSWVFTTTPV